MTNPAHSPSTPPWLVRLPSCPSTNTWALEHLAELGHGAVVTTPQQSAGRGQHGRTWQSLPGNLAASVVLRLSAPSGPALALAAGLAVIHTVEDACPHLLGTLRIKWPNDVWHNGQKLAGVLCEGAAQRGALVVGVGLNVAAAPSLHDARGRSNATCIASLQAPGTALPSLDTLLTSLRGYLLEAAGLISACGLTSLLAELRKRDGLLGISLRVESPGAARPLLGQGAGIADDGSLLVALPGGGSRVISSGRVGRGD